MKDWVKRNYKGIIISAFLIPIITVALVSISHVTIWYGISNPMSWAIYLSIGIEIAALSALAAISADMGSKVYFPFGIVTLIQFIGNIYFSYQYIDLDGETFKEWVELVSPLLEYVGVEANDYVGHKRFLSLFAGGMLPIISLSFLHMLVKFTQENKFTSKENVDTQAPVNATDLVGEVSRLRLSEDDIKILENALNNPPQPNEKLREAAEEYKKMTEDKSVQQSVTTEKIVEPEIRYTDVDEELNMYNDYVDFVKKADNSQITDSVTSQSPPSVIEEPSSEQPKSDTSNSAVETSVEEKKKN